MKKNSFMQGAFIATCGIVLSKILGMLYVIPFYSIIGDQGGALYGYAYSIYSIFLGMSQAGIPMAISKIISEYNVLGYYNAKERSFKLGRKTLMILGILCFIIMFVFAKPLSYVIIGNVSGGNTREDVTFVIRVISTAILVVPLLSIYRGFLQGNKYITPTSISQVLEQIVRVIIIIAGSYLSLKVFHLSLTTAVGIAVFSATVGALCSYFYLLVKANKNKKQLYKRTLKVSEPKISDQDIIKKILFYAFPFIMIDVFKSLINSVDVFTLVPVLVNGLGYTAAQAEAIMGVISTWGLKINMIIASIATGLMVSLIPNLTASFVKKDMEDVRNKINHTLQWLLFFTVPMTIGLSILAKPVWTIFYGVSEFGPSVYQYYVFVALVTTLFTAAITILQLLKEYKMVFIALFSGLIVNASLNVPLLYAFDRMGLPAYYGSTTSTILGYSSCVIISLWYIHKKYQVNYEDTVKKVISVVMTTMVMTIVLLLLQRIFPFDSTNRLFSIFYVSVYAILGSLIYFFIAFQSKLIYEVFGKDNIM
ncbi:MAG: polysaccharide biosynthesis protein, partial [Bacilli bacterium]|nr:polysaccharide biosynthesis protein [Bacilli bacterium]